MILRYLQLLLLIFVFSFAGNASERRDLACLRVLDSLIELSFLENYQYSLPFLKWLKPLTDTAFLEKIGWSGITSDKLAALSKKFSFERKTTQLQIGLFEDSTEKQPHIVLLLIFLEEASQEPVGYMARTIYFDKKGELVAHGSGAYTDLSNPKIRGLAPTALMFLDKNIYPSLRIHHELLKADYLGRYVWAKLGYDFEPTYWYKDVDLKPGRTIKTIELARRNFQRFLRKNQIEITDLVIRTESSRKPIQSLQDFERAGDFANAEHREGRLLSITPLIGVNPKKDPVYGAPASLPVGKAFLLSDYTYRPIEEGAPYVLSMARTKFSPLAMPYWNGYRHIEY